MFDGIGLTRPLWPHQVRALAALDRDVARGDRATYLVVPPGGGKTLIGLEAARRLGRPTVVLCPNTAIQTQWMAQWQASFSPDVVPATASRELPTPLTVLTYQALCTLGAAGNGEEAGGGQRTRLAADGVLSLLHPNGRALIARLQAGGPWTLVLDECHHLLELWGRLLQAVIEQLGQPRIVGLTATPPHLMTAEQAVLHRALFGAVDLEVSAPALVREGLLAPYQELAFLTRLAAAILIATLAAAAVASAPAAVLVVALVLAVVVLTGLASVGRTASRLAAAPGSGSLDDLAAAVADALHAAGLTSRDGDAVRVEAQPDGGYRARLQEVPEAQSALFAEALDEVLAPLSQPRYIIPRLILAPPAGPAAAGGLAVRRLVTGHVPATVVYHAVPTALSGHKKLALVFERAWNARVGPGSVVYADSPEGTGILAAQRGDDPFALTTQIRTLWR